MTDYIQAQGSAEARRQNLIEQLGRCEVPAEWQPTIRELLAEVAALKRKVLDNITRHEDVEAQIRRDAGEQVRVLREALESAQIALGNAAMSRPCPLFDNAYAKVSSAIDTQK